VIENSQFWKHTQTNCHSIITCLLLKVLDIANTLINIQKERKTAGMVLQHFYYSFTVLLNIEQSFPWLSARLKESLN